MKKLLSVVAALTLVGTGLVVAAPGAQAAPMVITPAEAKKAKAAGTPDYYSPKDGVYFNNPFGTWVQQQPILNEVSRSIDSVPRGGTIRMAVYSFTRDDSAAKVLAAYKRGVKIQILVDSHSNTYPATKLLRKTLGKDKKKSSFLVWCKQSCMSSHESLMHAKLYTFTSVGSTKLVSMVGSGNISTSTTSQAWNNMVTMTNNKVLYDSNVKYFNDMLKDKSTNYFRTVESGAYKEYYFPRDKGVNTDTMLNILKGVDCITKPAAGYGDGKGHTVVKIGMYAWTRGRNNLALALVNLKKQGCVVEVTYSGERVEHSITKTLLTKTVHGVIPIHNGRLKSDYNTPYMHHKNVLINGVYFGNRANKAVYTGTANFTINTDRDCNEIMLRLGRNDFFKAYDDNYNMIRDHYTSPVTSTKNLMPYQGPDTTSEGNTDDDYQLLGD